MSACVCVRAKTGKPHRKKGQNEREMMKSITPTRHKCNALKKHKIENEWIFVWHFEHARQLFECDKSETVHRVKCTSHRHTQSEKSIKMEIRSCSMQTSFVFALPVSFSPSLSLSSTHAVHVLLLMLFCCLCSLSLLLLVFLYSRSLVLHAHSKHNLESFTQF